MYLQIYENGALQEGPEPNGLHKKRIIEVIYSSLNSYGYQFTWKNHSNKPFHGILETPNGSEIDLYIYVWTISNGGRNVQREKRIQITSNVDDIGFERSFSDSKKTILMGIYENVPYPPIFAAWSVSLNREHGSSKSCFVPVTSLSKAVKEGFVQDEDSSGNPYVTFMAEYFGKYIETMSDSSAPIFEESVRKIDTSPVNKLDLSTEATQIKDTIDKLLERVGNIGETTRDAVVKQRVGQGLFKTMLMKKYDGKCCLCSLGLKPLLIGSHIKRWCESEDSEKLDPNNGLLLCALHDALFDSFFISFQDDGRILISDSINSEEREILGLNEEFKIDISKGMCPFIQWHRERLR